MKLKKIVRKWIDREFITFTRSPKLGKKYIYSPSYVDPNLQCIHYIVNKYTNICVGTYRGKKNSNINDDGQD